MTTTAPLAATSSPASDPVIKRARRGLIGLLLVGGVLVASHEGEFWPYSIYPMFSQAGRPWERVIVRRLALPSQAERWRSHALEDLPGQPVALSDEGLSQNDLADFVKLTKVWDEARLRALGALVADATRRGPLLVYRIRGEVDAQGVAQTEAKPVAWFGAPDSYALNPALLPPPSQEPASRAAKAGEP